jgi:hypothetical protein
MVLKMILRCCMSVIPVFRGKRQEDCGFQASLGNIVSSRPDWITQGYPVSSKQIDKQNPTTQNKQKDGRIFKAMYRVNAIPIKIPKAVL